MDPVTEASLNMNKTRWTAVMVAAVCPQIFQWLEQTRASSPSHGKEKESIVVQLIGVFVLRGQEEEEGQEEERQERQEEKEGEKEKGEEGKEGEKRHPGFA